MGYKKSFNLVTIQLIIPLSMMTKAEYKNAYGIDLDDIDIERVTLLQEEGSKNKYFVDEVKTTENGVDIYAGGKILSIGSSSVSVISGVYSVTNAKPIYYHGCEIYRRTGGNTFTFNFAILNNSNTPFTWALFKAWLNSMDVESVLVNANGFYNFNSEGIINIYSLLYRKSEQELYIIGNDSSFQQVTIHKLLTDWDVIFNSNDTAFNDRLNKIN